MHQFNTIGFIGFGLIGGSIARKVKQVHPNTKIMVYSRTKSTLETAKKDGNIDIILDKLDSKLGECDLIILCAPVAYNEKYLEQIKPYINENSIISDVGSTKTSMHEAAARNGLEKQFIGGHPMAGSERTGYNCSRANLLENAYYVITPTALSTQEQIDSMVNFAKEQSSIPIILDYKMHDYSVAAISHVPHIIAASLVNLVSQSDDSAETMRRLAAGGFKDITRIASSSPVMWEQICLSNSSNIIELLENYKDELSNVIEAIKEKNTDSIYNFFDTAGNYRNSINDKKGNSTMNPEFSLYCDIPDKPGSISVIASLLTFENISIKNIGINHNREQQEGTLKIEFHDSASCEKAEKCLEKHHFPIYTRKS